jgi:hypothetical protein
MSVDLTSQAEHAVALAKAAGADEVSASPSLVFSGVDFSGA